MRLLIDADACPVVDLAIAACRERGVEVLLLCDTAHVMQKPYAEVLIFDKGADSVDFALVNRVQPGDLVLTQDYGLAAMCLGRRARVLNQNGMEYTNENVEALLLSRHENKKLLRAGRHPKAQPKRTKAQDEAFLVTLKRMLSEQGKLSRSNEPGECRGG